MKRTSIIGGKEDWATLDTPALVLDSLFPDDGFKQDVLRQWAEYASHPGQPLINLANELWPNVNAASWEIYPFMALVRLALHKAGRSADGVAAPDLSGKMEALAEFFTAIHHESTRYKGHNKPNPDAVYWPDPTRPDQARSVYDTLPYIKNFGLISKDTPVGSAGSCFAIEMAAYLQRLGYNYVVAENAINEARTAFYLDFREERGAMFSANWGILFNSPSFMQIAERAFGERALPRLLLRVHDGLYTDPFRENVLFTSPAAYEEDYERHTAASRDALMRSEVFIITMGLNEGWQFLPDGSFIHRNPRLVDLYAMIRHRTLTVEDNVRCIQRFYDIVRAHNPKFKLVITVSPIPFLATGRADEQHVVVANGHSKAVLRVAAEQLVAANPDMYYLPSYEMITSCIKDPWEDDQRHVKRSAVERVMELFDKMFVAG